MDLSSLDQFKASSLLAGPAAGAPSRARSVLLKTIDFDPMQPRRRLDAEALQALADTIIRYGVLEPVSLRTNPEAEGRYVVNRGERRVRASRLAGLVEIPAFVDERIDPYAQVIENEHREDLSLFDLATFVVEREAAGDARAEIARRLGKPRSLITELAALQAAPPEVQAACRAGRIADSRSLYLLARTKLSAATGVTELLKSGGALSRSSIERVVGASPLHGPRRAAVEATSSSQSFVEANGSRKSATSAPSLIVEVAGRQGTLSFGVRDAAEFGEVVFDDGARESVRLSQLRLVAWSLEGMR